MKCIDIITDENFGVEYKKMTNPRVRYGARGIIIDSDGNVAVFNKQLKNEYKLPGGGIDKGEDAKEAFKREALEETGCNIEIIDTLGTIEEHESIDNFMQVSTVFVGKVIGKKGDLHLTEKEKNEGARLLWTSLDEARKLIKNCINNLNDSKYDNVYHSKFMVTRDYKIIDYYINNK